MEEGGGRGRERKKGEARKSFPNFLEIQTFRVSHFARTSLFHLSRTPVCSLPLLQSHDDSLDSKRRVSDHQIRSVLQVSNSLTSTFLSFCAFLSLRLSVLIVVIGGSSRRKDDDDEFAKENDEKEGGKRRKSFQT